MSSKAKKPNKRAVKITSGQVELLNALAANAKAAQEKSALAVATIAAGANIEKWGDVSLDGHTLTFGEPQKE